MELQEFIKTNIMEINFSEFISIVCSCITVFMLVFYDRKIKKQQNIINDIQIKRDKEHENEKKKANLIISRNEGKIHIKNIGKCMAENIKGEIQAINLIHSDIEKLPLISLEEGEFVDINLFFASQIPSDGKLIITICWDDKFKKCNIKSKTFI